MHLHELPPAQQQSHGEGEVGDRKRQRSEGNGARGVEGATAPASARVAARRCLIVVSVSRLGDTGMVEGKRGKGRGNEVDARQRRRLRQQGAPVGCRWWGHFFLSFINSDSGRDEELLSFEQGGPT